MIGNEEWKAIEALGDRYFLVTIYKDDDEEPTEGFTCYGSVHDIINCGVVGKYDFEDIAICISDFDRDGNEVDIAYGYHATSPDEWEIVSDMERIIALA